MAGNVQSVFGNAMQRLLHENWNPMLTYNIQVSAPEASLFEWENVKPEGKHWEETAQTAGNAYLAARDENEWEPGMDPSGIADDAIADIDTAQAQYKVKTLYQDVNFTDLMKEITNNSRTGFMNLAEMKIKDVGRHLRFMVSARLAGTALGSMGKVKSVNTTTGVIQLYGVTSNIWEGGNRYIKKGHVLDAVNGGRAGALRTAGNGDRGRRVTAVGLNLVGSASYPTITCSYPAGATTSTWADGDFLVMYNTRKLATSTADGQVVTSDDWQNLKNPWGIQDVADDGTYCPFIGGVDRTAAGYETYKSIVLDTGTLHDPSLDEMNQLCEQIDTESDGDVDWFYCHPSHKRFLMKFLTAQVGFMGTSGTNPRSGVASETVVRYNNPGADKVRIGYGDVDVTTLGRNGVLPIKTSRLAPMHQIVAFNDDIMKTLNLRDPGFMNYNGQTIHKVQGKAVYYATWVWMTAGVVCESHWRLGVIRSIKGSPMETPS